MQVTHLQIDGQSFYLEPHEDIEALKAHIIEAVTSEARFLEFRAAGYGSVSVLVTPRIGIRFEVREVDEEMVASWDEVPPAIDYASDY